MLDRYMQGWKVLNWLMRSNRSFSGHEPHSAFLNCGTGSDGKLARFADISFASGFAFPEDGRALAPVDWDFDGKLDVWLTNRTAPRVRFLQNGSSDANHWLALQLEGDGKKTNRDAIGARVELYLNGAAKPVIKTLHAGHAFISQSSRWIHFGLGSQKGVGKVVVSWPGGAREEFNGISADQFYFLRQGTGQVERWEPPQRNLGTAAAEVAEVDPEATLRTVLPRGMYLPGIRTLTPDSPDPRAYQRTGEGLFLVNVWASFCVPCLTELKEWSAEAEAFRKAGIEVLALNAEVAGGGEVEETRAAVAEVVRREGITIPWALAEPETVRALDSFANAGLDLWDPLPVPSSFLVDGHGEVISIYRGAVGGRQVIADAALASASLADRRDAATPFKGPWLNPAVRSESLRVAQQMVDRDDRPGAMRYLMMVAAKLAAFPNDKLAVSDRLAAMRMLAGVLQEEDRIKEARTQWSQVRDLDPDNVDVRKTLAALCIQMGDLAAATREIESAITLSPRDPALHQQFGDLLLKQKRYAEAVPVLSRLVEGNPKSAKLRYLRAVANLESGRAEAAVADFKGCLAIEPAFLEAANQLALIMAAHPLESVRAERVALRTADRLCRLTQNKNAQFLDTLGIAQASVGDFEKALASVRAAINLYEAAGRTRAELSPLDARIKLYEARKPYREARWRPE